jgi:CRISPR-associated protein Cmr3
MASYLAGKISPDNFAPPDDSSIPYKIWLAQKEKELDEAGQVGYPHLKKPGFFYKEENRLGIGIEDEQKRPSDGKLYTANFIRPKNDVGLLVEVTGLDEAEWQDGGVLSLGGERKTAHYSVVELAHWPTSADDGNKLYLATPTLFERGWQPEDWSAYFAQAVTPTAALVGRPKLVGGWDMAGNRPKPMQRYVPASSVYFFNEVLRAESKESETANVPVCDDQTAGQIGFGTTFIGRW